MRARATLNRAGTVLSAVAMGVAGLAFAPATASAAPQAAAAPAASQPVDHYNVGATHSPELLRQLAAGGQSLPLRAGAMTRAGASATTPTGQLGVDVASFQHPHNKWINWQDVANAGVKFAAVKVTEGNYYVNPWAGVYKISSTDVYPGDLLRAEQANLSTIAYAFANPSVTTGTDSSAAGQADYLLQGIPASLPAAPTLMLDIEYNPYGAECYGLSQSSMLAWIEAFETELIAKTTQPAIIYSTAGWLDQCVGNSVASLTRYPLWIAAYNGTSNPGMLPTGFTDWGIWQYSSGGTISGIPTAGATDLDVFNPDSVLVQGKLMVFNPGYQQGMAGSATTIAAQVNAYPEVSGSSLAFNLTSPTTGLTLTPPTSAEPGVATVSGTPAATDGSVPVDVSVSDTANGAAAAYNINFTWYSHGQLTLSKPAPTTVAGSPVDLNLAAGMTDTTNGGAPVAFQATGLPPGLSMSPSGLVTGWPDDSADSPYPVRVEATDNLKASASETFTWTVKAAPDSGPTGAFRLDLSGKCLNDYRNRSGDGNPANLWKCNGSAAQRWTYANDFTVRIHGKCLTAPATAGGRVEIEPCQSLAAQVWRLVYPRSVNPKAGTTPLGFVNPPSGLCLSDTGTRKANGTPIIATTCDGQTNQAWTLPAGPVGSQIPGLCLNDRYGRKANGTRIDVWRCRSTSSQRLTIGVDGTIRVEGKCLDVERSRTRAGTPIELWKCNGTAAQKWRLIPNGDGLHLVNPHSNKCLSDPGNSTASGTRVRIEFCAQAPGQRWHVL